MDAQKYKDQLKEVRNAITKQEYQAEKLHDKLEVIVDDVATCKLDLLNAEVVSVRSMSCIIKSLILSQKIYSKIFPLL